MGNLTSLMGRSPFLMGKLTISMAIFNSKLLNYQRVVIGILGATSSPTDNGFLMISMYDLRIVQLL